MFKDFPLPNHEQAPKAHEAAHCAGEQGKYWEMHDRIFQYQAAMQVPNLHEHAAALELDPASFKTCLESGKFVSAIAADVRSGEQLGVNSTPTMFINGRAAIGAQPFEYFKSVIDEELAAAKR